MIKIDKIEEIRKAVMIFFEKDKQIAMKRIIHRHHSEI